MTLVQLRTMLRRRLQEVSAAQWTDSTLNSNLNLGLQYMQRKIQAIDPLWVIYTDTTPLVSSQRDYPKPVGCKFEVFLYVVAAATDTSQDPLTRVDYESIVKQDEHLDLNGSYAHKGRFFSIYPTPSSTANYLKLEWVPTLSMGSDSDVPDLVTDLHEGIVYRAEMISLGDTAQEATRAKEDLAEILNDLPRYYVKSAVPDRIKIDLSHWGEDDDWNS